MNMEIKAYKSPQAEVIEVSVHNILCQSDGNESMREYDYGDGGFGNGAGALYIILTSILKYYQFWVDTHRYIPIYRIGS